MGILEARGRFGPSAKPVRPCQSAGRWLAGTVMVAVWSLVPAPPVCAQPTDTPARAMVFLRVMGDVEPVAGQETRLLADVSIVRQSNVEVATGSGFLISSVGYILTNHHVVSDIETTTKVNGIEVGLRTRVKTVEVLLGHDEAGKERSGLATRYQASIVATSPDLDLAVLYVGGSGFPYLPLGDSDALEAGDPITVLGFPFGRRVEIGQQVPPTTTAPDASLSRGDVAAFRTDAQGLRRFVQTTAALNPGNSGGPMLDRDGFVVGIINRAIRSGETSTSVGFAIPVNLARDFLQRHGLDAQLPPRLALGALQPLEGKALRVRLPLGFRDVSPRRTAVDTGEPGSDAPVLRIDRVVSPWTVSQLAETLAGGLAFETVSAAAPPIQRMRTAGGRSVLLGHFSGALQDQDGDVRIEYAVLDLGFERIVARYVGATEAMAFNASVLRASLMSLEADVLGSGSLNVPAPAKWTSMPVAQSDPASPLIEVPGGWLTEAIGPLACPQLPPPAAGLSASPSADFTTALRIGWLRGTTLSIDVAASACGARPGSADPGAYERRVDWLGVSYHVQGRFVAGGPGEILQLEGIALADRSAALRLLLAHWWDVLRR